MRLVLGSIEKEKLPVGIVSLRSITCLLYVVGTATATGNGRVTYFWSQQLPLEFDNMQS